MALDSLLDQKAEEARHELSRLDSESEDITRDLEELFIGAPPGSISYHKDVMALFEAAARLHAIHERSKKVREDLERAIRRKHAC